MIENSVLAYTHGSDRERNCRIFQRDLTQYEKNELSEGKSRKLAWYIWAIDQAETKMIGYWPSTCSFFIVLPPRSINSKKKKCIPRWARKRHLARVANHSEGFDLGSRG